MNSELVEKIANAVLYEGYILYPYRPSAMKNQQRWNFGAVYPRKFSEAQKGTDAWTMQTECLISGSEDTTLNVKIRFLQMVKREVGKLNDDFDEDRISDSGFQAVQMLEVGGKKFQTWKEAIERKVALPTLKIKAMVGKPQSQAFSFQANREIEMLRDENSKIAGVIVRRQPAIQGAVETRIEEPIKNLFKITIRITNETPFDDGGNRESALMRAFVSTHTILNVKNGEFVSLLEPPEALQEIAAGCQNIGTYPVLIGETGERDCVLSSPIILYDYPQIAPESAGDFFDGTEIDEMLTLRILTLTDDEKHEMSGADERTRRMLERTETMPPAMMLKLHGAARGLSPKEKE